jgi:hypothetical protein
LGQERRREDSGGLFEEIGASGARGQGLDLGPKHRVASAGAIQVGAARRRVQLQRPAENGSDLGRSLGIVVVHAVPCLR